MQNILIVGCAERFGLELTRHFLAQGSNVFVVSDRREDYTSLFQFGAEYPDQLVLFPLDITALSTPQELYDMIGFYTDRIDRLVLNAAAYSPVGNADSSLGGLVRAELVQAIHTNAVSPLMIIQSILPFLMNSDAPLVLNILPRQENRSMGNHGASYGYDGSKAALKMYIKILAGDLSKTGIQVVSIQPDLEKVAGTYGLQRSAGPVAPIHDTMEYTEAGEACCQ